MLSDLLEVLCFETAFFLATEEEEEEEVEDQGRPIFFEDALFSIQEGGIYCGKKDKMVRVAEK